MKLKDLWDKESIWVSIFCYLLIGILIAMGIRAGEYLIPAPDSTMNLMVCISDADGRMGACKPFERYFEDDK